MGGFRGGAEGPRPPFFKTSLFDPNPFNRPENRFIKCSLILSFETLTLLYFAPRGGGGGGGGDSASSSEFSGSAPAQHRKAETRCFVQVAWLRKKIRVN